MPPQAPPAASPVALEAYAASLPALRLPAAAYKAAWGQCAARGLRRKAVCAFDEDAVTLAVAAARAVGAEAHMPDALFLGATTLPYDEKPSAATVVSALSARSDVHVVELRGSTLAGLQALAAAADYCRAHPGRRALAIAADAPASAADMPLEHGLGAGAAAFVVGPGPGPVTVGRATAVSRETFGARMRRQDSPWTTDLELRSDTLGPALADLKAAMTPTQTLPARLAVGGTAVEIRRIVRHMDVPQDAVSSLFADVGDAGAASAALALAEALDKAAAGDALLALATGAGAIALELRASDRPATLRHGPPVADQAAAGREVDYVAYLKHRGLLSSSVGGDA